MQQAQSTFHAEGINIVGLSYDNPQILKEFAERQGISFPLLSDSDSSSLRSLGLVNPEATGMTQGVALPGIIYLDEDGRLADAFFEDSYRDRPTPGTVLARLFPGQTSVRNPDAPLDVVLSQTGDEGIAGSQWELLLTFNLPPKYHLYGPNESGYQALELELEENEFFEFGTPNYPQAKVLESLGQKIPVYQGRVTLRVPVKITAGDKVKGLKEQVSTTLKGRLSYQICTDSTCLMPESVDVTWSATVKPLDRQRADTEYQHQ